VSRRVVGGADYVRPRAGQPAPNAEPPLPGTQTNLSIAPLDPSRPAPRNAGLNSNYHYIGYASTYRPDAALWCHQDGPTLRCGRHPAP
jgi:hypothetical protein